MPKQWNSLRRVIKGLGAEVDTLDPMPALPDLVFTANAAVVLNGKAVLARFRHGERRDEEPVFDAAFRTLKVRGIINEMIELPQDVTLEGAGDCIYDTRRDLLWLGCGFRSDAAAAGPIGGAWASLCHAAARRPALLSSRHRALRAAVRRRDVLSGAFTPAALAALREHVAPGDRIELSQADAARFAANAVCVGRAIVLSSCGDGLRAKLERRGYAVVETPLDRFQKSGGSACCLTLRLDHRSATAAEAIEVEPAPAKVAAAGR